MLTSDSCGAWVLLGRGEESLLKVGADTRLLRLSPEAFDALCERYLRLGIKLYRNLMAKQED